MQASVMYPSLKQTLQFASTHVQIIEHTMSPLYVNILIFNTMHCLSSSIKVWLLGDDAIVYEEFCVSCFQLSVSAISGIF